MSGDIKTGDLVVVNMLSGEMVMGRFQDDPEALVLLKPFSVMLARDEGGNAVGARLMPYQSYGIFPELESVPLPYHAVLMVRPATEKLAAAFQQASSGIQIAKNVPSGLSIAK